uniref:Uncharacterized protein n=1 Tax=Vespula pensylvanica TaxID=30213 RepID=A0A834PGS8_VESPE|nr:hypothetical protein H0235_001815 [Vespula pensylvanica]
MASHGRIDRAPIVNEFPAFHETKPNFGSRSQRAIRAGLARQQQPGLYETDSSSTLIGRGIRRFVEASSFRPRLICHGPSVKK